MRGVGRGDGGGGTQGRRGADGEGRAQGRAWVWVVRAYYAPGSYAFMRIQAYAPMSIQVFMKKPPAGGGQGRGRASAAVPPALCGVDPTGHALMATGLLGGVVVEGDAPEGGEDGEEASEVVAGGAGGHGLVLNVPLSYRHPCPPCEGVGPL